VPDCGLGPGSGRGNGLDTTCVTEVEDPTPLADAALDHTTAATANTAANPIANSFNLITGTTFTSIGDQFAVRLCPASRDDIRAIPELARGPAPGLSAFPQG